MHEQTINGIRFLRFDSLSSYTCLFHAMSTRTGGISPAPFHSMNLGSGTPDAPENIRKNYDLLAKSLGFDLQTVVTSHQVHGSSIARIETVPQRKAPFPAEHILDGYDAFITATPGIVLMVRVADCVPVILFDPAKKALALVHAGWKGTLAGIAGKTANALGKEYGCDPENIRAGIGPAIGPCCFMVREDVSRLFFGTFPDAGSYVRREREGARIDLHEANRLQLLEEGLRPEHIEISPLCTACNLDLFFSHRGEQGKTGRLGLLAGLRPGHTA